VDGGRRWLVGPRGRPRRAALAEIVEPAAWLRFNPAVRDVARVAAVAVLWALALADPPSRGRSTLVIVVTVACFYGPTVGFGLLSDDFLWARPWTARELLGAFAGTEDPLGRTTGTYRPIADITRAVDHALWASRAEGAHFTNVVFVTVAGVLAWALGLRLRLRPRAALAVALAWMAHPLSVAAVAWVSQRTDTLAAIFYVGCLGAFLSPGRSVACSRGGGGAAGGGRASRLEGDGGDAAPRGLLAIESPAAGARRGSVRLG
jgi:hypothetical protein